MRSVAEFAHEYRRVVTALSIVSFFINAALLALIVIIAASAI
jgi:uncharacterized membrane protein